MEFLKGKAHGPKSDHLNMLHGMAPGVLGKGNFHVSLDKVSALRSPVNESLTCYDRTEH